MFRRSFLHWYASVVLLFGLVPLFHFARLPFRIDFTEMASAYWLGATARAVVCATLLYLLAFPWRDTVGPVVHRVCSTWWLAVVVIAFLLGMMRLFGWFVGSHVVVFGIGLAELMIRRQQGFGKALADVTIPAVYLFFGVLLFLSWQHGIAAIRFAGSYDRFFHSVDLRLFHADVSAISHFSLRHLPGWTHRILEFAYYSLFTQMGAALIIVSLANGRKGGIGYVATLLAAYYIGLVLFAIWPAIGPFSICEDHVATYDTSLTTLLAQETMLAKARLLLQHSAIPAVQHVNMADLYIAFPCLHMAFPLIVIWSLRQWPKMVLVLAAFDVLLVASIVILEWHYLIDLVAGVAVGALAIASQAQGRHTSIGSGAADRDATRQLAA